MKRMFTKLAIAGVLSGTGVFAGTFSDVPSNHWAYKAVEKVSSQGLIKGYQEKFRGDAKVSRYEMATIISRMLDSVDRGAVLDQDGSDTLGRLVTEFSNELALIGAKVDVLEAKVHSNEQRIEDLEADSSKVKSDRKIKFSGELGLRWTGEFSDGLSDRQFSDPQVHFKLNVGGKANSKTWWGATMRTAQDSVPGEPWVNFGSDAEGNNNTFGGSELRLNSYYIKYKATDNLKFKLGKHENPFANTELVFDNDIRPTGLTQSWKVDKNWKVMAGQYKLKDATDRTTGAVLPKEDVYLFAHKISFNYDGFGGKWSASAANYNFSGEQFVHPGQDLMAGKYFNNVASNNGTGFAQTNVARSGNLYNVTADGSLNSSGNAANNLNATTQDKQLRLLSDFHVINGYLAYTDDSDARDPWGVKFDYAVNNSAWNEEDTGFWAEIWRGKLHDKGSVHYGLQYIRVEADAVLSFLNKDEIQTNVKGTRAHFATRVQRNMDWFTTYFLFEPVSGLAEDKAGVLRTGLTLRF